MVSDKTGWDAINDALSRLYGDAQPFHLGTEQPWALGGPDPLDGISIFGRTEPVPHWHYVSYGMSDVYGSEMAEEGVSGWGFEFTFRLVRQLGDTEPPIWPANFLQNLGRYVFKTENWFEPGHTINANGPIAASRQDSAITALTFMVDPELGQIETPSGSLGFLQVVGLTELEYEAAKGGNAPAVLEQLGRHLPLHVTDIERGSLIAGR